MRAGNDAADSGQHFELMHHDAWRIQGGRGPRGPLPRNPPHTMEAKPNTNQSHHRTARPRRAQAAWPSSAKPTSRTSTPWRPTTTPRACSTWCQPPAANTAAAPPRPTRAASRRASPQTCYMARGAPCWCVCACACVFGVCVCVCRVSASCRAQLQTCCMARGAPCWCVCRVCECVWRVCVRTCVAGGYRGVMACVAVCADCHQRATAGRLRLVHAYMHTQTHNTHTQTARTHTRMCTRRLLRWTCVAPTLGAVCPTQSTAALQVGCAGVGLLGSWQPMVVMAALLIVFVCACCCVASALPAHGSWRTCMQLPFFHFYLFSQFILARRLLLVDAYAPAQPSVNAPTF